jgi:hypothetical protein
VAIETGAEILHDRQQTKNPAVLGHVADSKPRQFVRRQVRDRLARE